MFLDNNTDCWPWFICFHLYVDLSVSHQTPLDIYMYISFNLLTCWICSSLGSCLCCLLPPHPPRISDGRKEEAPPSLDRLDRALDVPAAPSTLPDAASSARICLRRSAMTDSPRKMWQRIARTLSLVRLPRFLRYPLFQSFISDWNAAFVCEDEQSFKVYYIYTFPKLFLTHFLIRFYVTWYLSRMIKPSLYRLEEMKSPVHHLFSLQKMHHIFWGEHTLVHIHR